MSEAINGKWVEGEVLAFAWRVVNENPWGEAIQEGYLKRTSRGREATEKAYKHLKVPTPKSAKGAGLFD